MGEIMDVYMYLYIMTIILHHLVTSTIASQDLGSVHRVVYRTFVLSDGAIVQCYGGCKQDVEDSNRRLQTFQVTRCEGQRLRLSCTGTNKHIRILSASVGRLSPDIELCNDHRLVCSRNVTNDFQKCEHSKSCNFNVPSKYLKDRCGKVKYLSLDIQYNCVNTSKETLETTMLSTSTESFSPSPNLITRTLELQTPKSQTLPTPYTSFSEDDHRKKNKFFWLLTVYAFLTDSNFIAMHKAHMALAIILSIFVGLVVSLFFILDHSRRTKRKKMKKKGEKQEEDNLIASEQLEDGKCDIIPMITITKRPANGCLKKDKIAETLFVDLPPDDLNHNTTVLQQNHGKLLQVIQEDFFKEPQMGGDHTHSPCVTPDLIDHRSTSLSHLPPPPKELLENHSPTSSSSGELIPPPWEFQSSEDVPSLIITSPTPTNSSSNTLVTTKRNTKIISDQQSTAARPCLKQSSNQSSNSKITQEKKVRYPSSMQLTRNFHPDETILSSVPTSIQRKLSLDNNSADFIIASQMDMTLNRSVSNDFINNKPRTKSKRNESPLFQTRLSEENKTSMNSLNRNPRKGKLHVIPSSEISSLDDTFIDNSSIQPCAEYCTAQIISPPRRHDIPMDNIHTLNDIDDDSVLVNDQIDQDQERLVSIEESGYQSRETGTDSLCSSNRSTDNEDFHVFSPTPLQGILKTKTTRQRERSSKREPVANVKVLTKVARRMRYENRTQSELRPSESSMEDTSSRDSVKIPRTRIKTKRREIPPDCKRLVDTIIKNNSKYHSDPDVVTSQTVNKNGNVHTE